MSSRERVDRFQEFTRLLLRLRDDDHVTSDGHWFSAHDMRTLPRVNNVPVLIAANGPRSVRFAAHHGDGWITTGPPMSPSLDAWRPPTGAWNSTRARSIRSRRLSTFCRRLFTDCRAVSTVKYCRATSTA